MLTTEQINDLHRLYWSEHWPIRRIERHLNMGWKTIRKYLDAPAQGPLHRDRPSKLDPFKGAIAELQQLNLKAMSRQAEAAIADAAARNLSVSATLELLADMELEARHSRAIERRFKCSRLQSQPGIDAFQFHHHKSRTQARLASCACSISDS